MSGASLSLPGRRFLSAQGSIAGRVQRAGLVLLGVIVAAVLAGPLLSPYAASDLACAPFQPPSAQHWLGCNDVGQDLLTGVLTGGRISLSIGVMTALLTTVVATLVAITAAYRGGVVDQAAMRLVDVVMSLPFLPLVIVLGAFFGASLPIQVLVITLVMWAQPVRELRAQALSLRSAEYVEAARAMGASGWRVTMRHILPELTPLIVPQFIRVAHNAILLESSLSFLGLGDPVRKSWGAILFHANARTAFLTDSWVWWVMPPGMAIALTVVAFALIGYGIGDGADTAARKTGPVSANAGPDAKLDAAKLGVRGLTVDYETADGHFHAVDGASFRVAEGETLGLVGESGSGKSTLAMAVLGLLAPAARIARGDIRLDGTPLLALTPEELNGLRGKRIALVPQSAMNALNPVMTIGSQIVEAVRLRQDVSARDARKQALELLRMVDLPEDRFGAYPHELSGGMRQRAVIAIALANRPEVLIADEPTTGLDVLVQAEIMALLRDLQRRFGITILFVTHDLPLIARAADRLAIMLDGRIVETGTPDRLTGSADHPHTKALFDSMPHIDAAKIWNRPPVPETVPPLLDLEDVTLTFNKGLAAWFRHARPFTAVDRLSLAVRPGEVVGLVGGSGSGKTTTARLALGRYAPDSGHVRFDGGGSAAVRRRAVHMVFQDPYQSLRPRMRIGEIVAEPLHIHGISDPLPKVREALAAVRLPSGDDFLARRAESLSGGQRQRVAFARAVVTEPKLILADEPTSMLDQSIRLDILNLMETLRREKGVSFLFITHDIVMARHFCDRLVVMRDGRAVEAGTADEVALRPRHPYTRALIAAVEETASLPREAFERLAAE